MKDKKIVGICGLAEAGKSTAAKLLGGEVVSFAKPLKDMLATLGLTHAQLYGDQKEVPTGLLCGRTPRHAMQTLGTEWGRECIASNIWTEQWKRRVAQSTATVVVCDDVRFENEVEIIRSLGGVVIALKRDTRIGGTATLAHQSEGLDYAKFGIPVIDNNGTLEQLDNALRAAIFGDA